MDLGSNQICPQHDEQYDEPDQVLNQGQFDHRIYRLPEVLKITGVSKPSIYRWVRKGHFPKPVLIGGQGTRAKGWRGSDLNTWNNSLT